MKKALSIALSFILLTAVFACNGARNANDITTDNTTLNEIEQNIVSDNNDTIDNFEVQDDLTSNAVIDDSTDINADLSEKDESGDIELSDETLTEETQTIYALKNVNVRKEPSYDSDVIGLLQRGQSIQTTGLQDGWYCVIFNSEKAYIKEDFAGTLEAYEESVKKEEQRLIEAQNAANIDSSGNNGDSSTYNNDSNNAYGGNYSEAEFISKVVELCNKYRADAGLPLLTQDSVLDAKAQIRANEATVRFDHTRPDGSSCFTVLDGVDFNTAGENIAGGQVTPEQVVEEWMNSPSHRENIMCPDFRKIGVGYTTGGYYGTVWVQIFTN